MDREEKFIDILVDQEAHGQRIDLWLASAYPNFSRSKIQKSIKSGKIVVNGSVCKQNALLNSGDHILGAIEGERRSLLSQPIDLDIVYEDDDLIVLNKPAGISVHPGAGVPETTLVEGLLDYCGKLSEAYTSWERPGIVHRLDKGTSGLMVCAKTDLAFSGLAKQFAMKTNTREYRAFVDGLLPSAQMLVENHLHRDPRNRLRFAVTDQGLKGKFARSYFVTEATFGHRISLVRVKLFTGRTHQIRVHAKHLGAPVLGDPLYHSKAMLPEVFSKEVRELVNGLSRQMLHAFKLGFTHPLKGDYVEFIADFPEDMDEVLGSLRAYKAEHQ